MITHDRYQTSIYAGTWSVWTVSIVAGADAEPNPVPGIQFTHSDDRLDFTAATRFDFSSEDV